MALALFLFYFFMVRVGAKKAINRVYSPGEMRIILLYFKKLFMYLILFTTFIT